MNKQFLLLRLKNFTHAFRGIAQQGGNLIDARLENKEQSLKMIVESLVEAGRLEESIDGCLTTFCSIESDKGPEYWLEFNEVELALTEADFESLKSRLMGKFGMTYFEICQDFSNSIALPHSQSRSISYWTQAKLEMATGNSAINDRFESLPTLPGETLFSVSAKGEGQLKTRKCPHCTKGRDNYNRVCEKCKGLGFIMPSLTPAQLRVLVKASQQPGWFTPRDIKCQERTVRGLLERGYFIESAA